LANRASCFSSLTAVTVGQTTRPCCPPSVEGTIKQRQHGAKAHLSHGNTMPLAYPTILRGPALASQCNQYGSTRGADSVIDTPHFLLHKARGSTCTRTVPPSLRHYLPTWDIDVLLSRYLRTPRHVSPGHGYSMYRDGISRLLPLVPSSPANASICNVPTHSHAAEAPASNKHLDR
jgi:hypothetical protein